MKITSYAVARPAFYDRTSTTKTSIGSVAASAGAGATFWTYTVAAARSSVVNAAYLLVQRASAATATSTASFSLIGITPSGGSSVSMFVLPAPITNTANAVSTLIATQCMYLSAGDAVYGQYQNADTGGVLNITANINVIEYNA